MDLQGFQMSVHDQPLGGIMQGPHTLVHPPHKFHPDVTGMDEQQE